MGGSSDGTWPVVTISSRGGYHLAPMWRPASLLLIAVLFASAGWAPSTASEEPEATATSEHFSITWVTDPDDPHAPDLRDGDSDGVPDAIEALLESFEASRALEVDRLGYRPPPVEGRYELYVAGPLSTGSTQPAPGGSGRSTPSYIVIPPEIAQTDLPEPAMLAWAAHEYFHAVQLGYDSGEDSWIYEASSAWIEDVIADDADPNHQTVRWFVPTPRVALTASDGQREYGAFLFLQFLTERFAGGDPAIVRELWEEMAVPEALPAAPDRDAIGAIFEVLSRRGIAAADAWGEFLLWRWRLDLFAEGQGYRDALLGEGWPRPRRADLVRFETCQLDTGAMDPLAPWAGDYVQLVPHRRGPEHATARLAVEGPPGATAFTLVKPRTGAPRSQVIQIPPDGAATVAVPFGRGQVRRVTLGMGTTAEAGIVGYSLRLPGGDRTVAVGPAGGQTTTYPNTAFLTGSVECRDRAQPLAEVLVTETEMVSGATRTWTVETEEDGRWGLVVQPEANARYTAEVVDPLLSAAEAGPATVGVRVGPVVEIDDPVVSEGEPVVIAGSTAPPHPGAALQIEFRRPERAWQAGPATTTDAEGRYRVELPLPATGFWEVRVRLTDTGDEDHLPGVSLGRHLIEVRA